MRQVKEHIVFKSLIVVLSITLLLPSVVKLAHSFSNHQHIVCNTPQDTHFHSYDVDCAFYKFKVNTQFSIQFESFDIVESLISSDIFLGQFDLSSYTNPNVFYLRGPPKSI